MLYGAMNFPVRPVLEELKAVSALGFDYLELAMDTPQAHHSVIRELRDELLRALDKSGMKLVCHLPAFVFTADLTESLRQASLQETIESLRVAADLQPLKVVLHPSYMTGLSLFVRDLAKQHAAHSLDLIVDQAEQLGLTLYIENMFPRSNSLCEPADFVDVFERFPGLRLTLDTGHANIGSTSDRRTLEFIKRFPDRIGHIHANDNFGKEDNHLPIGTGTIDFPRIIKAIKGVGYDDTVTFEVFSRDRDYLTISREKFAAMLATA